MLFKPLTLEEIERIVDLQIEDVRRAPGGPAPLTGAHRAARDLIAREGYDPVYGARPLKRFIQHEVETRIGRALLSGELTDGTTILLDVDGDELTVRWRPPGTEEEKEEPAEPVGAAA